MKRLVNCILQLGFSLGWRYWRMSRQTVRDPSEVERWIADAEKRARMFESHRDYVLVEAMRMWIEEVKKHENKINHERI